jgi:hypothetical protein
VLYIAKRSNAKPLALAGLRLESGSLNPMEKTDGPDPKDLLDEGLY